MLVSFIYDTVSRGEGVIEAIHQLRSSPLMGEGEGGGDIVFKELNDLKKMNPLRANIFTGSATCASFNDMDQPADSKV
jgi:hypothetical protein